MVKCDCCHQNFDPDEGNCIIKADEDMFICLCSPCIKWIVKAASYS